MAPQSEIVTLDSPVSTTATAFWSTHRLGGSGSCARRPWGTACQL